MADDISNIQREAQTLDSLISVIAALLVIPARLEGAFSKQQLTDIVTKEVFTSAEDEEVAYWFARFITLRSNLWMIVDTAIIDSDGIIKDHHRDNRVWHSE
jgi:hypothetical protein